jgi:antitoxin MazE
MKASLVAIGNSRGVRLPKPLIEQCGFGDEIELDVRNGEIVLRPARRVRQGWEAAFQRMARSGDDRLLEPVSSASRWDKEEWQWK